MSHTYVSQLKLTTQGPPYPPSEIMDEEGNFIVIGNVVQEDLSMKWGAAIVAADSPVPQFGKLAPYRVLRYLDEAETTTSNIVLHTVSLPLACNNYPLVFAPEQLAHAHDIVRPSLPLHEAWIPDWREEDGRKVTQPITLAKWCEASGTMRVTIDGTLAHFHFEFSRLIPDSLYTVMVLRQRDIRPDRPVRPGPLGIPNVLIADSDGQGTYRATLVNPFPADDPDNRVIDVILLWMSTQMSCGGAIGLHGLGGDVHAQLKSGPAPFLELVTKGG